MIDELEFNEIVSDPNRKNLGRLFLDDQFLRAIREGTISTMNEDIKAAIMKAYEAIRRANHELSITLSHWPNTNAWETAGKITHETIIEVNGKTKEARRLLLRFLGSERS